MEPKDAILHASHILNKHLEVFLKFGQIVVEDEAHEEDTRENKELLDKLKLPVSELELSVRSGNCLREARIKTIGELVTKSEQEMLQYRNFGKKSLQEIAEILKGMGLSLGMEIPKEKNK
jgi:DNA-directed RNA polymerase subunit alpha